MNVTEVRIKLVNNNEERLLAFASIIVDDCFCVRDLKIVRGENGDFVAMPSRKLQDRCKNCNYKVDLTANYCSKCGNKLESDRAKRGADGRLKLHGDIAHPITRECRAEISKRVLDAFDNEKELAKKPGYMCRYFEIDSHE